MAAFGLQQFSDIVCQGQKPAPFSSHGASFQTIIMFSTLPCFASLISEVVIRIVSFDTTFLHKRNSEIHNITGILLYNVNGNKYPQFVLRNLQFTVQCLADCCLSFFLLSIVLSVLLRFMASDPFDIFKLVFFQCCLMFSKT